MTLLITQCLEHMVRLVSFTNTCLSKQELAVIHTLDTMQKCYPSVHKYKKRCTRFVGLRTINLLQSYVTLCVLMPLCKVRDPEHFQ